jgi:hypothetical protein
MGPAREGDDEKGISRIIPDGADVTKVSLRGSCQLTSRFEVTLI